MSTVNDWLALHRLGKQEVADWLEGSQRSAEDDGRLGDAERYDQAATYILPQQEVPDFVENQVLPAFHLMLGVPWAQLCQAVARSRWTLHTDPNWRSYARLVLRSLY